PSAESKDKSGISVDRKSSAMSSPPKPTTKVFPRNRCTYGATSLNQRTNCAGANSGASWAERVSLSLLLISLPEWVSDQNQNKIIMRDYLEKRVSCKSL